MLASMLITLTLAGPAHDHDRRTFHCNGTVPAFPVRVRFFCSRPPPYGTGPHLNASRSPVRVFSVLSIRVQKETQIKGSKKGIASYDDESQLHLNSLQYLSHSSDNQSHGAPATSDCVYLTDLYYVSYRCIFNCLQLQARSCYAYICSHIYSNDIVLI
jgi:hypothetical protein